MLRCVVRFVHHSSRTWTGDKVWPPCIDPTAARPTMDLRLLKVAEWVFWQRRTVVKSTMANALRFIFSVKGHKRPMISKSVMISNNTSLMSNWRQLQQATNQSINQSTFFWFNSVLKSLPSALIRTQNASVEVFSNYSSSQNGPLASWANDSEAMRARGIIILVKSNYLVKNIETKQL